MLTGVQTHRPQDITLVVVHRIISSTNCVICKGSNVDKDLRLGNRLGNMVGQEL